MIKTLLVLAVIFLSGIATAQPALISELPGNAYYATNLNGALYFIVGNELWTSDGTEAGTGFVDDLEEVVIDLQSTGNHLYITTYYRGYNLYISDGTSSPVTLYTGFLYRPKNFAEINGISFFVANNDELWTSDGTEAGTEPVIGFSSGGFSSLNDHLYFVSSGSIWRTDGLLPTPELILEPQDLPIYVGGSEANDLGIEDIIGIIDNQLLFTTIHSEVSTGYGMMNLYSTDGTSGNFTHIKEIQSVETAGYFASFNDKIIFTAVVSGIYNPVWITDGTEAGTLRLLEDVGTDAFVRDIITAGSKAALIVESQDNVGIWLTDGTPENSRYFHPINAYGSYYRTAASVGSYLFFPDHTMSDFPEEEGIRYWELWQSNVDEETAVMVSDLTSQNYIGTDNLININNVLYFSTGNSFPVEGFDITPRLWKYEQPFLTEVTTSAATRKETGFSVYPNPFTDKLHLENAHGKTIIISNAMGNIVHEEPTYTGQISLSSLPEGMYFVHVKGSSDGTIKVLKVK